MITKKPYRRRLLFSGLINFNTSRSAFEIPCVSIYYDFDICKIVVTINHKFSTSYLKIDYDLFKTECLIIDGYATYAKKIFIKQYTELFAKKIGFDEVYISPLGKELLYKGKHLSTEEVKENYGYIV